MKQSELPIQLYYRQRIPLFILSISMLSCYAFFIERVFNFHPILMVILGMVFILMMIVYLILSYRVVIQQLPYIIIHLNKIQLLNPLNADYKEIYFRQIERIDFSFGRVACVYFFLKHQHEPVMYVMNFLKLNDQIISEQQVKTLIEVAWKNYQQSLLK